MPDASSTKVDQSEDTELPKSKLQAFVEDPRFSNFIIVVILINAVTLGLETSTSMMEAAGDVLLTIDRIALGIFIVELLLKLVAYRHRFFLSGWNIFDAAIVTVAIVPAGEGVSVLRALRILRAFKLINAVPKMRGVVQALLTAIPAMGTVVALLSLVFYVFAVMATKLFSEEFPDWFGSVAASLYTLFQIMTLESWSMGIVRPVMSEFPWAWALFVPFILVTTFAVVNLFIAVIVNSMQEVTEEELKHQDELIEELRDEVSGLKGEIQGLRMVLETSLAAPRAAQGGPGDQSETGPPKTVSD